MGGQGGAVEDLLIGETEVGFERDDGIAELGRRFVVFGRHCLLQVLAEPDQFVLLSTGISRSSRQLAAVLSFSVDVLE